MSGQNHVHRRGTDRQTGTRSDGQTDRHTDEQGETKYTLINLPRAPGDLVPNEARDHIEWRVKCFQCKQMSTYVDNFIKRYRAFRVLGENVSERI